MGLDAEMHKIMSDKAEASEKWKKYDQALQKYLFFVNEQRKPLELSLPDVPSATPTQDNTFNTALRQKLVGILPGSFKTRGGQLFDLLEAEKNITWDQGGLVTIDGALVPQSNIVDLVSDAVRTRKTAQALSWGKFASLLKQLRVPIDLIGNEEYKAYIRRQTGSGVTPTHHEQQERGSAERGFGRPAAIKTKKNKSKNAAPIKAKKNRKKPVKVKWNRWFS
jgi:hypothetical protein